MSAYADDTGAYVLTESAHVFTLASDCHSWLSDKSYRRGQRRLRRLGVTDGVQGRQHLLLDRLVQDRLARQQQLLFDRAGDDRTVDVSGIPGARDRSGRHSPERTWLSQSTWVQPVTGCSGTVYVYWGDHWDGTESTAAPGKHNYLATYVFQPLVFNGTKISLPTYKTTWKIDVGAEPGRSDGQKQLTTIARIANPFIGTQRQGTRPGPRRPFAGQVYGAGPPVRALAVKHELRALLPVTFSTAPLARVAEEM